MSFEQAIQVAVWMRDDGWGILEIAWNGQGYCVHAQYADTPANVTVRTFTTRLYLHSMLENIKSLAL